MKILLIYGTRPEIIKLSSSITKLDKYFELITVFTTQNFDRNLSTIFFEDLEMKQPDYILNISQESPMAQLGSILTEVERVIIKEKPDCFLILGDTNSCLSALVAKKHKIPIFHIEAGNRCFDERVPEEVNRRIVDVISDINIVYSHNAKQNLINEGLGNDKVFVLGSPMKEVLSANWDKISTSNILAKLGIDRKSYFVLSIHRSEAVDDPVKLKTIMNGITVLSNFYKRKVIFSCHPRTWNKVREFDVKFRDNIKVIDPLSFTDYMRLQKDSLLVISDSGTITEEAAIMKFKAINLRDTHERQEGTDVGVTPMSRADPDDLIRTAQIMLDCAFPVEPVTYQPENFSDALTQIITGYTQYIKRTKYFEI